ncbi:hypothetical protein AVEN_126905-1 [Araneus ventricosus]|uniref:Uncharacterized protein n=1 Tax=Araneus ventricosus TaxID=182803 RepID=A0A4Y2C101_ARAVE|nr:hypothetical protein AVEN_126905-1 [Araneus ventricosus]
MSERKFLQSSLNLAKIYILTIRSVLSPAPDFPSGFAPDNVSITPAAVGAVDPQGEKYDGLPPPFSPNPFLLSHSPRDDMEVPKLDKVPLRDSTPTHKESIDPDTAGKRRKGRACAVATALKLISSCPEATARRRKREKRKKNGIKLWEINS